MNNQKLPLDELLEIYMAYFVSLPHEVRHEHLKIMSNLHDFLSLPSVPESDLVEQARIDAVAAELIDSLDLD